MSRVQMSIAVIAALACTLVFFGSGYVLYTATLALVFGILAIGLNILVGNCGQVSLGHAAFFGIGAYASAILSVDHGWSFWTALPVSVALTSLAGLLLGLPALRTSGHYLILVTLGFGEIVRIILQNWQAVTKGPTGISGIPPIRIFGFTADKQEATLLIAAAFLLLAGGLAARLLRTRVGREMASVRDNEVAAELLGVNAVRVKLIAFVISAAFAGVAGSLYAHIGGFISPDVFTIDVSLTLLVMVMLGGAGSTVGAVAGAFALTALPEVLREFKQLYLLFYGIGILLLAVYLPRGVAGWLQQWVRR